MKKKISLLVCLFVMILTFTGCAKTDETVEYNKETIEQTTEFLIEYCNNVDDLSWEQWTSLSEYAQNYQLMQAGLPFTPESFQAAVESWKAGVDECGEYLGHGDYSFEADEESLKVSTVAEYEERDATILFTFDEKLQLETMTINAEFSLSEILKKAGLNTVLGMGTVFAVLIFISIIISLFGFIPKIEAALKKKGKEKVQEEAPAAVADVAETVSETDDLELVAVISAAIAAMEGTGTDGFVVRSIRRRPSNKWKA